jgi:hypothetical protein
MTHSRRPSPTIDDKTAHRIRDLHKRHPQLGHHGLFNLLQQEGIHVQQEDLQRFLDEHHIRADKPWRPWKWRGVGWPWKPRIGE